MKNINKHTFEEQFKRKFDGAKLAPPEHIWAKIQKTLPKPVIVPLYKQNWFRAAATIVLVLGLTTWFAYPESANKTQNLSQQEQQIKEIKNNQNQENNLTNKTFKQRNQTNKVNYTTNLTKELQEKGSQLTDNQELTPNKNTLINSETKQKFVKELIAKNQKTNQLTTNPLIENKNVIAQNAISKIEENKIKLLDAVTLALIKAQLENELPLKQLVLKNFESFPITEKAKLLIQKRFLLGFKVSAGNLNLNYSGDNSQNAIGLKKTLSDYDSSTLAINTDLFDNLRKAKGSQFSVGMDIGYFLSPKWSINFGFAFVNQKYSVATTVLHTTLISSSIQGTKEVTKNISNSLETKWQSLNIPLVMAYHIGNKKLTASISFGIAANMLLTQNYKTQRLAYDYKLGNQKKTYFNSVIGFKLNYKLAPRWYWSTGMDYQNTLGSILNEERVSLRPETYQANTGFYFSF